MIATRFEFKYRGLLIGVIAWAGYAAYAVDHVRAVAALARWIWGPQEPEVRLASRLLLALATLLVGFGAIVRTWGAAYLQSSVVHDAKLHSEAVVADGPYRYVRHPLYFASIVSFLGFAMLASRLGFLIMTVLLTLLYVRLAGREEVELGRERGELYRAYCRRVPKLLPALTPRVPATGAEPKWSQAFRGEAFMWCFAAGFGLFAMTLNQQVLWWVIGIALLLLLGQTVSHNRRRKKQAAAAE